MVAAGLQIARWKCSGLDVNWRRVYRSLIFMDCWLSYTLGYRSEVTPHDIAVGCRRMWVRGMWLTCAGCMRFLPNSGTHH